MQSSVSTCVRADVRVQASARQSCSIYKNNSTLTFGLLHPPSEFSLTENLNSDEITLFFSLTNETLAMTLVHVMNSKSDQGFSVW